MSSAYDGLQYGGPVNAAFAWSNRESPPPSSCATNPAQQGSCYYFAKDGASQFNPESCRTDAWNSSTYLNGTWDSDVKANDPLSVEFELHNPGPTIKLAYYFLDAMFVCRTVQYELYIDGLAAKDTSENPLPAGRISNFASGKYVVFDIAGLSVGDHTFKLVGVNVDSSTTECAGTPNQDFLAGVNTHISSVFVSGPNNCQTQPLKATKTAVASTR